MPLILSSSNLISVSVLVNFTKMLSLNGKRLISCWYTPLRLRTSNVIGQSFHPQFFFCCKSNQYENENENFTPMLPSKKKFVNMVNKAVEYVVKDVYENEDLPICGSGYRWVHSYDDNEMMNAKKIYSQFYETPLPQASDNYNLNNNNNNNNVDDDLFESILCEYFDGIKYSARENQSGNLAYMPGGGLLESSIASFISSATNRYITHFMSTPAAVGIEDCIIKWFAQIIGMKDKNIGGCLTSGGSMATLQAIHCARESCMCLYVSLYCTLILYSGLCLFDFCQ